MHTRDHWTRSGIHRMWGGWQHRLAFYDPCPYRPRCGHGLGVDAVLTRYNDATDTEYTLPVRVEGVWVPEERGCTLTPDIPGYWEDVQASYFRPGRGWKFLELDDEEVAWATEVLEARARAERYW